MAEEELPPATRLRKMYPRIHSGITNPIPKVPIVPVVIRSSQYWWL